MDRKILLSLLGAALLGFVAVLLLMPEPVDDGIDRRPWQVSLDASGHSTAFGFVLGRTSLAEVRQVLQEEGELNLFHHPGAALPFGAEAYFEQIELERLRADVVVTLAVDQAELSGMYDRGLRISQLGSGAKKVKLDPADAATLAAAPIRNISYLPKARLDPALIAQRFGQPARRLRESASGIEHWLYPERGIDVGLDANGRAVIQYVNPGDFAGLLRPLIESGNGSATTKPDRQP